MADGSEELVLNALGALLEFLQVTPQAKKVWFEGGFAKRTQILGVLYVLDVEPKYCQVPADKVQRTTALGDRVARMAWVPADLCQELMGLLIFHGRVLLSAKWHLPFTVRGAAVAATHGVAPMTEAWRTELAWWRTLLMEWNCAALLVPHRYIEWKQEPFLTPMTDASRSKSKGTGAAGAMFGKWYQHWDFSAQEIQELHIMELEGVALVVWLRFLCSEPEAVALLKGRRFLMRCDNDPFVKTVNRRHSTYPSVAFLLGEIHHLMAVAADQALSGVTPLFGAQSRQHSQPKNGDEANRYLWLVKILRSLLGTEPALQLVHPMLPALSEKRPAGHWVQLVRASKFCSCGAL